jgi:hypothetical protein
VALEQGYASAVQGVKERLGRRIGEKRVAARVRIEHHGSVLDDEQIEELKFREDAYEVVQSSAGVQDQLTAGGAEAGEDCKGLGIDATVGCYGLVVVCGKSLYMFQNSVQS